jgi:hypothetical protein
MPQHLVQAQGPEPVKIRVAVDDVGFNGNPGDFTIEVEEGALVELTFVWAHQAYLQEEHIIILEGYNLESDKITADNRETTVKFIADRPGNFSFRCDIECDLHDYLQQGHLKVTRRGGGGGAATFTPTVLRVTPSSWVTGGDPINLMVVLQDVHGTAVPKAEVYFTLDAEFAGTRGEMEIGRAKTDAHGVAFLDYQPLLGVRQHKITAHFEGLGIYDESQQAIEIQELGMPPTAYTLAPIGLESIRHWAPTAFMLVLVGIWIAFGYVLYQVVAIARQ